MKILKTYIVWLTVVLLLPAFYVKAATNPYAIVEVTGLQGNSLNYTALLNIARKQGLPASAVYRWDNHLIVYGKHLNTASIQKSARAAYPSCQVTVYSSPFYDFNRALRCGGNGIAKQWDNIILTANLVANERLQQEYIDYHAGQFKNWPEVSKGFCNAGFQQLLVFRNGRRLMLVISIPKGKKLDDLNPKTIENNPRINDWNRLMKKYQEGVPGTRKGEVWVFFKQVTDNSDTKRSL
ncbi:L-rhamnose mutarotase [Mucilaginibacter sp. Mucisp86]|uniref:L-rhamnose mutarotase n=1 Tax=Mucilaginibacter sp. Mucisp86 TaxID=3243060 RepID=UPI0039B601C2